MAAKEGFPAARHLSGTRGKKDKEEASIHIEKGEGMKSPVNQ